MGMDPLTLGLTVGGISAAGSLLSGISASSQKRAQAANQEAQAEQLRQQANLQQQQGQIELENIDKQRSQIRKQYEHIQSGNAVALGAGNVDLSSGSAMDVAQGNANEYAMDIGENAYSRALKNWQTQSQVANTRYQADVLDANASYAKRTANNLLPTLIGAGLSGLSGFTSGYSFGGKLSPASSASNNLHWDRALQGWSRTMPRH